MLQLSSCPASSFISRRAPTLHIDIFLRVSDIVGSVLVARMVLVAGFTVPSGRSPTSPPPSPSLCLCVCERVRYWVQIAISQQFCPAAASGNLLVFPFSTLGPELRVENFKRISLSTHGHGRAPPPAPAPHRVEALGRCIAINLGCCWCYLFILVMGLAWVSRAHCNGFLVTVFGCRRVDFCCFNCAHTHTHTHRRWTVKSFCVSVSRYCPLGTRGRGGGGLDGIPAVDFIGLRFRLHWKKLQL